MYYLLSIIIYFHHYILCYIICNNNTVDSENKIFYEMILAVKIKIDDLDIKIDI